jgi:ABC-type Fe3+/spermidine/putrescine transport system ATPase subunit
MIEIKNLTKKFNKFTALNQVNIRFNDGHSVALIGPNGCGKTTLIKCILGLNVVEDGDILVNNESVKEHYLYRKNIGYMPQIGRYPENMTIATKPFPYSFSYFSQLDHGFYPVMYLNTRLLTSFSTLKNILPSNPT